MLQRTTLTALTDAMKQASVNESTGQVTSAGTTITVANLDPDGVFYSWQIVYQLLDDYQVKNSQGRLPLVEHYFAGHETWTVPNSGDKEFSIHTASRNTSALQGDYTVTTTVDEEDTNDIIYVEIARPKDSQTYYGDIRKISAVKITADKKDGQNWIPIYSKKDNGDLTDRPNSLWRKVEYLSGESYGFNFRISSLDKAEKGGKAQFGTGDTLRFNYTIYYDKG